MRRSLVVGLIFLRAILSFSQTKHPFTFEDMMALKRVEEPVPSPDGKWVLFAAVDVDWKANTKTPHVWVVPLQAKAGSSAAQDETPSANHPASVGMTRSGEREIISDQDADRPRWAPDGKRFAFVSTKEGGSQIWIADFDGATGTVTAKYRLTNIATEASGELWSPDGKNILITSDVYPECDGAPAAETACNAKKVEETKNSKVKAQIFSHLMYRHWNAYKEGKRTHLFVIPVIVRAHGQVAIPAGPGPIVLDGAARDLTPGDYDAPPFSLGGQDDYAFSPDGQEICFSSNHDPVEAISTNKDLFTVPVNFPADASSAQVLAATKNITAENKAADETPLYSPDGKYIAYRAQARPGYESDTWRLMLHDRKTAKRKVITHVEQGPENFAWTPDSRAVAFVIENQGMSEIDTVLVEQDERLSTTVGLSGGGYDDGLTFDRDGKTLLFDRMSLERPNEIFEIRPDREESFYSHPMVTRQCYTRVDFKQVCEGWGPEQLSHMNDSVLSEVLMSSVEPFWLTGAFWFTGAHNDKVEGFLVKPPDFDPSKKYPVKFLIHGGPEGAWGDDWSYRWNPELFAANGYVVIMINFHGSTGYGQKFIDAINGDWGGAPFEDLMKGLDYAEQNYPFIDKTRECALGASYGGYMANWILGHTDRFKCIVSHDGVFNTESAWGDTEELWFNEWEFKGTPWTNREMYRKWSPHLSATNFKTPTLVIHSQLDYRLDVSQGFDLFTTLQREGVPSKMLYFPDEGHWVLKPQNSQLWYKTVNDWVDQWTKPVGSGQ
jgi:dipeptidyl aminopeptidase/acylaminoacyl peptidase